MQYTLSAAWRLAAVLVLSALSKPAAGETGPNADPSQEPRPTRIVLVADPGTEELASRFAAELSSLHFEVVRAPNAMTPANSELEALAEAESARAVVRVGTGENAVDLWLVNAVTHEVVYRRVVSDRDPAIAVLRSLEILRGSLVDVRALAVRPEPPALRAPAPEQPRPAQPRPSAKLPAASSLWLGLSGAIEASAAGRGLAAGALGGLHASLATRLWLHAEVLVPISGWSVSGEGGRVKVRTASALAAVSLAPWGERRLTPDLGLGIAALALSTRGEANAGYRGTSDFNVSAYPHARLGAALVLSRHVRLHGQFFAGFALPRPVLLFADQRDRNWLSTLFFGALGVEVKLL